MNHYFMVYMKEDIKIDKITGKKKHNGYVAVIDSQVSFKNFKRIYTVDEIEYNILPDGSVSD